MVTFKGYQQKKGHKNKHKKTWMKWNDTKWTIWSFQQCACLNAIYFAPVVTTTYHMKNNKSSTRGHSPEMSVLARAREQLLMLYTWGKYLEDCSIYIEIGTSLSRAEWMSGICLIWSRSWLVSPCLSVTIGIWTLAYKSDPRAEISGEIVWYAALALRPELPLCWCFVCACAASL